MNPPWAWVEDFIAKQGIDDIKPVLRRLLTSRSNNILAMFASKIYTVELMIDCK